ncbi:cell division protein FtsI (penicillin-binding protein 3) [Azospirillaceae bacterium]
MTDFPTTSGLSTPHIASGAKTNLTLSDFSVPESDLSIPAFPQTAGRIAQEKAIQNDSMAEAEIESDFADATTSTSATSATSTSTKKVEREPLQEKSSLGLDALQWHRPGIDPSNGDIARLNEAVERGRNRLVLVALGVVLCFFVICLRLVEVTVIRGGGDTIHSGGPAGGLSANNGRADIVDRNGVQLATSLATQSLYADPKLVLDAKDAARKLVSVLGDLEYDEVYEKLNDNKRFVWIKRNLTPRQHYAVHRLGLPGLMFQKEERRFYPQGPLTSHVVGYSGIDNNGLAGLEQSFDKTLRTQSTPLQTALDVRVQHILRREILAAIDEFHAIGGAGVVSDVNTGEVLAMVSLPDFSPQSPGDSESEARFNRNTLGVYEMGSTFKIFNSAMSLDSGKIRISDSFDAMHNIHIGRFTIKDLHPLNRMATVAEIFLHSSNLGSVRMAQIIGVTAQKAFMAKMGFLKRSTIELPELARPLAPNPWREVNLMTISFGHGISVSPIHLVTAASAVINGGIMRPSTILKYSPAEHKELGGERVVSFQTSQLLRKMFRLVVTEGTGKSANVPGLLVGGKTGTADKQRGRHYAQNARLSSFLGVFPIHDPHYLVLIMIDEPKATAKTYGFATGGWVAAPAVGRVIKQIGPLLGVPTVDESRPDIRQMVEIDYRMPSSPVSSVAPGTAPTTVAPPLPVAAPSNAAPHLTPVSTRVSPIAARVAPHASSTTPPALTTPVLASPDSASQPPVSPTHTTVRPDGR